MIGRGLLELGRVEADRAGLQGFVAAEDGLGYFIQFSTSFFRIPQAFAGLFFLAVVSLLLFKSVQWIQQWFFPWSLPRKGSH